MAPTLIDTRFNMRVEAGGRDPDTYSSTLRRYHRLLWSKALPGGAVVALDTSSNDHYLLHRTATRAFRWSSDAIVRSMRSFGQMHQVVAQLPLATIENIERAGETIAGYILFPGYTVDRKPTINGARGMHPRIRDRWDLTLECIRRHYADIPSPLSAALDRYSDFFALFENFEGYVDFFLLQDHVRDGQVKFYLPCEDFGRNAFPATPNEYRHYLERTLEFVTARAARIDDWARANLV